MMSEYDCLDKNVLTVDGRCTVLLIFVVSKFLLFGILYIRLFHHEGSTKSITDKKYKSDRTRARGMYKNIKSYLTNTFKPT